jgi:hypothetical protein
MNSDKFNTTVKNWNNPPVGLKKLLPFFNSMGIIPGIL